MPSIRDIFPDKWLKASHLILADSRRPILAVVVRGAGVEPLHNPKSGQKEPRLIVEFEGKDKRMILNKTQAEAIAAISGTEDYTKWRGVKLAIQAGIAPNKKDTILVLAPAPAPTPAPTPAKTQTPTNDPGPSPDQDHDPEDDDLEDDDLERYQDQDHDPEGDNPFT